MQIDPNNPTFQPMEKQFLIEQVQIMVKTYKSMQEYPQNSLD